MKVMLGFKDNHIEYTEISEPRPVLYMPILRPIEETFIDVVPFGLSHNRHNRIEALEFRREEDRKLNDRFIPFYMEQ